MSVSKRRCRLIEKKESNLAKGMNAIKETSDNRIEKEGEGGKSVTDQDKVKKYVFHYCEPLII